MPVRMATSPPLLLLPLLLPSLAVLLWQPPSVVAQYGPDPPDTPPEFMCAWRKLAANYAKLNRPDAEAKVHDALQLSHYCPGVERPREEALPKVFPPPISGHLREPRAGATYVDAERGSDVTGTGTQANPFATVGKGVAAAAAKPGGTVILRNGTYYLHETVQIPPTAHGLTIEGMAGEAAWVSGGTKLDPIVWKPHNLTHGMNIWSADLSHFGLDSVPGLRVNGRRVSPARYPNADPELTFWPVGYMTSDGTRKTAVPVAGGGGGCSGFNGPMSCGSREPCAIGCSASWKAPKIAPKPNPAHVVNVSTAERSRLWDVQFSHYSGGIGGTCSIYDPPFSFWCSSPPFSAGCGGCFTWNIPGGIDAPARMLQDYDKKRLVSNGHVVAWRAAHWANWHFEIDDYSWEEGGNASITFGRGGFQGARGGEGSDWYISNVFEELDAPTEFYYDIAQQTLYYFGNGTHGQAPAETFVATKLHTLFNVSGASKDAPLRGFTLRGVGLRDTSPTMLEPHAVPSGGDWALERIGSVFLQNTEDATITGCEFTRIGGNGVMISAYNQHTTISHSEFAWMGGSAIAAWGWTDEISDRGIHGVDGTTGTFPRYTKVLYNLFREVGV